MDRRGGNHRGGGTSGSRGQGGGSWRGAGRGGGSGGGEQQGFGQIGGGRGGGGGGGGGFGRGGPQMQVTKTPAVALPEKITNQIIQNAPLGWTQGALQPPPSSRPGTVKQREIGLIINHVPSNITLPDTTYQYEIAIDLEDESKKKKEERRKKKPPSKSARPGPDGDGDGGGDGTAADDAPRPRLWKKIVKHCIPLLEHWHNECTTNTSGPSTSGGGQPPAQAARIGGSNIKQSKKKGKKPAPTQPEPQPEPPRPSTSRSTNTGIKFATDGFKQIYTVIRIAAIDYEASYGTDDPRRAHLRVQIKWNADLGVHEILVPFANILSDEDVNTDDIYIVRIKLVDQIPAGLLRPYVDNMLNWVVQHGGRLPENATKLSQIYNIVLKTVPMFRFIPVGRASFFPMPSGDGFDLGGGLVNWSGHSLIFNFGWKPFVNIDLANSAFLLGRSVLDVLDELCFQTKWNDVTKQEERRRMRVGNMEVSPRNCASFTGEVLRRANNLLKSCMVFYQYGNGDKYTKRVTEVLNVPPPQQIFLTDAAGQTDLVKYCRSKNLQLRELNGVCLKLGKTVIVAAEICKVVKGQVFTQKLEEAQTANMIKDTAKPPAIRRQAIEDALEQNNFSQDPVLREFGVRVDGKLHSMEKARVLPPPTLVYGSSDGDSAFQMQVVPGREGTWAMNRDTHFFMAAQKVKWGMIQVGDYSLQQRSFEHFVKGFIDCGRKFGLDLGTFDQVTFPALLGERDLKRNLYEDLQNFQKNGYKMVVLIIPRKDTNNYATVKQTAELTLQGGILTQVVVEKNVNNYSQSTIENLILKVNSKLGGTNYLMQGNPHFERINILKAPVIIVGADVTHPASGSRHPSIAAVTASLDRTGMPFMMHTQAQRVAGIGAAEIIEGLDEIMRKFLQAFIAKSGYRPRKIIFYRDGVGDSQFAEVLQREMLQIRTACTAFGSVVGKNELPGQSTSYEPKITFIAVQKRHKTRMFPINPNDGVGKPKNAPPGTVVDTEIVSSNRRDFFLLSHLGIQGTSRPTRYQVLWDDSEFNMDELELLSFYLCFMYCRCTRSVSYPAPTYYAHLAATRGKTHIHNMDESIMQDIDRVNQAIAKQEKMITEFPMYFI